MQSFASRFFPKRAWTVDSATGLRNGIALTWHSPIVLSGLFILVISVLATPFTWFMRNPNSNYAIPWMLVPGLWLLFAHSYYNTSIPPKASLLLLVMECWSIGSMFFASWMVGRGVELTDQTILLLSYFLMLATSSTLVWLYPKSRGILKAAIFFVVALNALVGVLQKLNVSFATQVQDDNYKVAAGGRHFFGHEAVRSSGFSAAQSILAATSCLALFLLCTPMLNRRLKWYELALIPLFLCGVIFPQVRSVVPGFAIGFIVLLCLAVYRYKLQAGIAIAILIVAGSIILPDNLKGLGYLTGRVQSTTRSNSLAFRQRTSWPQVGPILKELPATGFGPDQRFTYARGLSQPTSRVRFNFGDRWVTWGVFDGSYHHLLAIAGWGGLIIVLLTIVSATFGLLRNITLKVAPEQRAISLAMLLYLIMSLILFGTFEDMWWKEEMWLTMIAMGLTTSTREETRAIIMSKFNHITQHKFLPVSKR